MDSLSDFSPYQSGIYTVLSVRETDSTNRHLDQLLQSGANLPEKVVLRADFQTEGRGMMHASWSSEQGQNLLCSILVRKVPLEIHEQFLLSMATCLSVADCLSALNLNQNISLKWPNDVYMDDKKVCGILIQNSLKQNRIAHAIVGIGLNINQIDFDFLPEATSIQKVSGIEISVSGVLDTLLIAFERRLEFLSTGNRRVLHDEYCQLLLGFNDWALYRSAEGEFEGKIRDVMIDGQLLLEDRLGRQHQFEVKEIRRVAAR